VVWALVSTPLFWIVAAGVVAGGLVLAFLFG